MNPDDKQMADAFAVPAKLARKFTVAGYPDGMLRLAFGETPPHNPTVWHSAVALGHADAVALRDLLTQQIDLYVKAQP